MEAFSKFIAIILLAVFLFMVPLMYTAEQNDSITQSYVTTEVTNFVENVKKQGKITQGMYNDLLDNLGRTANVYEIDFVHRHKTVIPVFSDTGEVLRTEEFNDIYYTDDIKRKVFYDTAVAGSGDVKGEYHFSKGDYFTVIVKNRNITLGTRLKNMLFGSEFPKTSIFVTYGGTIQDENF